MLTLGNNFHPGFKHLTIRAYPKVVPNQRAPLRYSTLGVSLGWGSFLSECYIFSGRSWEKEGRGGGSWDMLRIFDTTRTLYFPVNPLLSAFMCFLSMCPFMRLSH